MLLVSLYLPTSHCDNLFAACSGYFIPFVVCLYVSRGGRKEGRVVPSALPSHRNSAGGETAGGGGGGGHC